MDIQFLLIERDQLLRAISVSDIDRVLMYNNRYNHQLLTHSDKLIVSDLNSEIELPKARIDYLQSLYSAMTDLTAEERRLRLQKRISYEKTRERNIRAQMLLSQRIEKEVYLIDCDYLDTNDLRKRKELLCQYLAVCMLIAQYPVLLKTFKRHTSLYDYYHGNRQMFITFDPNDKVKEMRKYIRLFEKQQLV